MATGPLPPDFRTHGDPHRPDAMVLWAASGLWAKGWAPHLISLSPFLEQSRCTELLYAYRFRLVYVHLDQSRHSVCMCHNTTVLEDVCMYLSSSKYRPEKKTFLNFSFCTKVFDSIHTQIPVTE